MGSLDDYRGTYTSLLVPRLVSTWQAAVDRQLANVQPPHFEGVYGQCAHTPAFQGECANGETSDGERTNCGGPERESPEGHRAKTERASGTRRCQLSRGIASLGRTLSNP